VPDESTSKFTTSSERAGIVPEVPNEVIEGEVTWLSTNDEEKANEDDDRSINIEEINDERIDLENGDQEMTDAEKIVAEKLEEEKGEEDQTEEEQANYDQAPENQTKVDIVGTLVTIKSFTNNYNTNTNTTNHKCASPVTTTIPDPLPAVIQRSDDLERKFDAWTKVDHSEAIEASLQDNVINEVKNQLPKAVKELVESRMESTVRNVLQKDPINLEQHESQKDVSEICKINLDNTLSKSLPRESERHLLISDEDDMDKAAPTDPSTQLKRKHDDQDENPIAGSKQGKEKKRPRKDT
ncbi:hypothetical protein Tco_0343156, partial [Tanacetum coccineum]